jgi:hypothetical protein
LTGKRRYTTCLGLIAVSVLCFTGTAGANGKAGQSSQGKINNVRQFWRGGGAPVFPAQRAENGLQSELKLKSGESWETTGRKNFWQRMGATLKERGKLGVVGEVTQKGSRLFLRLWNTANGTRTRPQALEPTAKETTRRGLVEKYLDKDD